MSGSEKEGGPMPEKQSGGHFANGGAHEPELKEQRKSSVVMQIVELIQEKTVLKDQTKTPLHLENNGNVIHTEKLL